MRVTSSGETLGATIEGLDLSKSFSPDEFDGVVRALGERGVVRFPTQKLTGRQLADFSARFGELEINVANAYQEPGIPEVMILSNMVENGKPIGLADAGQDWHTDMSYSSTIAFANVLYGIKIPRRGGRTLGATEFSNMHAAYDGLPAEMKRDLEGMTVLHDFNKFWEMMRREKGSKRPPLTDAQRKGSRRCRIRYFSPTRSPGAACSTLRRRRSARRGCRNFWPTASSAASDFAAPCSSG